VNSTAIEGNTYTLQETRIVLLDGITVGGKSTHEHLEIVNHKELANPVPICNWLSDLHLL
jgi:Fic family protein